MALPTPNLDDRKFQDLVEEARSMIPRYCPRWTDHNLSDPGITLIELFAWMVDVLLYRLNKVPEKNYVKFLELIGVKLMPPAPAKTDITFHLSQAQQNPVVIPKGTEGATVRTETEEAITFITEEELNIEVPTLDYFLVTHAIHDASEGDAYFQDYSEALKLGKELEKGKDIKVFADIPKVDNAFYLGYKEPLAGNILHITLDFLEKEAIGVNPNNPPYVWEYWDGDEKKWRVIERKADAIAWLEDDGTRGLNCKGDLKLHLPHSFAKRELYGMAGQGQRLDRREAYWLRCRVTRAKPDLETYDDSPDLRAVHSSTWGGTVPAINASAVAEEELGKSDGTPGQTFRLLNSPVLSRLAGEVLEVQEKDGGYEQWQEVADFSQSGPEDRHFVLDSATGEVRLGTAIRQPSGDTRQFGKIVARGASIRFSSYRYGGGSRGNVGMNTITVLKSSIPYVQSVTNRRGASGGRDGESLENAKLRGPKTLRTLNRAVTAEDFELLTLEASPSVARAKCIHPGSQEAEDGNRPPPGVVKIVIVPALSSVGRIIKPHQIQLSHELKQLVREYLNERKLLTTVLVVDQAEYRWVKVRAKIKVKPKFDSRAVRENVESQLYHFLNPLSGGLEGNGWPFGRHLRVSDVHSCVQGVDGVDYVEEIDLIPIPDPEKDEPGTAAQLVEVPPSGLICSGRHEIVVSEP